MGVCTSTKERKDVIQANKKGKKEDNTKGDKINEINDDNKKNIIEEKGEEKKGKEGNNEEKNNEEENMSKESKILSDEESENDKQKSNKNKDKGNDIMINFINNGKVELTKAFKSNDNISFLFDFLFEKKSKYEEFDLTTSENLSLLQKLNEKIGKIFPDVDNVDVYMISLGLDIARDVKEEYEISNKVIATPMFDLGGDIGLLIYAKKEKSLKTEIIKNQSLLKFNHLSSICNGKNMLFLSGGEAAEKSGKNNSTTFFTSINLLKSYEITDLPNLKKARSWHSMIYIPKKYIFIVGGGTDEVELYDIEKNEIAIDSKMNEIRNESTLFIINNTFLYSFCGMSPNGSFISTVEKCNLRQKKRMWSYVNYTTEDNALFGDCFYVGAFFSDTSIILFAANEDENNEYSNILFDLEYEDNPTLRYYETDGKILDVVPEKIFYPLGNNTSIMLPLVGTLAKVYRIDESMKLNVENYPDVLKNIME